MTHDCLQMGSAFVSSHLMRLIKLQTLRGEMLPLITKILFFCHFSIVKKRTFKIDCIMFQHLSLINTSQDLYCRSTVTKRKERFICDILRPSLYRGPNNNVQTASVLTFCGYRRHTPTPTPFDFVAVRPIYSCQTCQMCRVKNKMYNAPPVAVC